MIYKEDEDLNESFENSILKRYGGFLKLGPPNTPIQVKARIYLINAILYKVRDSNLCNPYISIQAGDNVLIEDTENGKENTSEPMFGSLYEFDLKFPYESQITISIKDWSLLGNKSLIGNTTIDLENRFYSNCYANCGIPKRYDTSGYNTWRDILTPTQILSKLCKKWRINSPEYGPGYVRITCPSIIKEYRIERKSSSQNQIDSSGLTYNSNSARDPKLINEDLALTVLNDWYNITGVTIKIKI